MDFIWLSTILALSVGFTLGLGAGYFLRGSQHQFTSQIITLAKEKLESERALSVQDLQAKKDQIGSELQRIEKTLGEVTQLMQSLEKDREGKFGDLTAQLKATNEQTQALYQTTHTLKEALASTKKRGEWGERMAEDVLRVAGFMEGINYHKQHTLANGGRPDFTFCLPQDRLLNMDVKFPLDNYRKFLEAPSDAERDQYCKAFLKDVKLKLKEASGRDYIDPEAKTLDYVLLFIPNEQVYGFVHEQDPTLLDEGLKQKVIFCSPVTLFAVLAVIRQAVTNFAFNQTSNQLLGLLEAFRKQWDEYVKQAEKLGRSIETVQKDYEALSTTRRNQLEKPLKQIEALHIGTQGEHEFPKVNHDI